MPYKLIKIIRIPKLLLKRELRNVIINKVNHNNYIRMLSLNMYYAFTLEFFSIQSNSFFSFFSFLFINCCRFSMILSTIMEVVSLLSLLICLNFPYKIYCGEILQHYAASHYKWHFKTTWFIVVVSKIQIRDVGIIDLTRMLYKVRSYATMEVKLLISR